MSVIGLSYRRDWMSPSAYAWVVYIRGRAVTQGYGRDPWAFRSMAHPNPPTSKGAKR